MIIGVGTDLCDIRRIEHSLQRFGQRFIKRLYGEIEQKKANCRPNPVASYAQGFAAKEACAKALGTGFRDGVFWRDIVVANYSTGQPYIVLTGGAKKRFDKMIPNGMSGKVFISQTDEYPMAQAFVVISANNLELKSDAS
jgi:holo-[acyl-carrier protein] synthase